ncbi:MAG: 3'-5' exonuclease domain-containing protein 2 [Betaproteobacteria bacterium]|jgi:ribonuclease D|nr:3'-5' exonuclease domain-containing protein 2 [Betaproteobacteria bacterium]
MTQRIEAPTKIEIALLEPFAGLPLDRIVVPSTGTEINDAAADLATARFVGFDTESKPVFAKGEVSDGPHVVQFSTLERAYIFQLHRPECHEAVGALLASIAVVKVGFGLRSDQDQLPRKLGVHPRAVLDLNAVFRRHGYRKAIGVKAAVAVVFKQKFQKSRRMTTSNWARRELMPNQLIYAANDAYAAVKVLDALRLSEDELPITDVARSEGGSSASAAHPGH